MRAIESRAVRALDGEAAENKGRGFPDSAHDEDPAEFLAVVECLIDVVGCCKAEEDAEEDCGWEGGAVVPVAIGVIVGWRMMLVEVYGRGERMTYEGRSSSF